MNKYQEALDYLRWIGSDGYYKKNREKSFDILQELVDKATPMKPLYKIPEHKRRKDGEELAHCPVCEWRLNWKYGCQNNKCRQCIDWSEDE